MVRIANLTIYCMRAQGRSKYQQEETNHLLQLYGLPSDLAALCAAFAANLPPLPFVSNWELWQYAEPEYDELGNYGSLPSLQIESGQQIYHGF